MTNRRTELDRRWQEAERKIQELHAGKVTDGDPAETEGRLLEEQDAIEYELGMLDFEEGRHGRA